MGKKKIYLISRGVNRARLAEFKEKLDKISRYEGIYDMGEVLPNDPEIIRKYLHNLIDSCKVVTLLLGTDSNNSRFLEQELRIGLGKRRAAFCLEGEHLPGSSRGLPGQWQRTGISIQKGDIATVKRMLDFLTLWYMY
jgi:hypothetical protein